MGETITLKADDGHELAAYLARPAGTTTGGLVVLQEIFGVNAHIRGVTDGFAADGFTALAPALFDRAERGVELGYDGEGVDRGRTIRAGIELDDALRDVAAAIQHLKQQHESVAVVGYCWGGSLAWGSATRLEGVARAVCYYGGMLPDMASETPRCPVIAHFGESDTTIPMDKVEAFKKAQQGVPVYVYPAGHGFNCDARASFDAESARLARERTLEFLKG